MSLQGVKALLLIALTALIAVQQVNCVCRDIYKVFTERHTSCLPPNKGCQIMKRGVSEEEKLFIIADHNRYRQIVASGNETSKQFPASSDMLQMEWDDELAQVAQAHAEQCNFEHDCFECREVDNFVTGQNLFLVSSSSEKIKVPNWSRAFKVFYDEINISPPKILKRFEGGPWGHFTQMVWAKTWKVGCGYVQYKVKNATKPGSKSLYTCNYGPAGNTIALPMYARGKPVSKCPENTRVSEEYPQLCKSLDKAGPSYDLPKEHKLIWECQFPDKSYCKVKFGPRKLKGKRRKLFDGYYLSFTVAGGQSMNLTLPQKFGHKKGVCFEVVYRKYPTFNTDSNSTLSYMYGDSRGELGGDRRTWSSSGVSMLWPMATMYGLEFRVPDGAEPQTFDLRSLMVYTGQCISTFELDKEYENSSTLVPEVFTVPDITVTASDFTGVSNVTVVSA
ncbi:CRISP/Allergen/PR-1 [Halotydeus destructor]|nr:CRISP/Allergen/PR-1 [Halotydeus destructor]